MSLATSIDVVVIGGGAAGMMAALAAKERGLSVVVLEKNAVLGKKLRITGGGRCNITNATPVVRDLLSVYKQAGKFLFSPFSQFGVHETREWFDAIGVPTVEEAERRVFPVSQSAVQVTEALIARMNQVGVEVRTNSVVQTLVKSGANFVLTLATGSKLTSRSVIVATGGLSRPETGSTGDALPWLETLGHTIHAPRPSLVPVKVHEKKVVARLSGVSLPEAGIKVYQDGQVLIKAKGKVLFTHDGLSGPGILNLGAEISRLIAASTKQIRLELDLCPAVAIHDLETLLLERLMQSPNKLLRNQFSDLLPMSLVLPVLEESRVDTESLSHSVTVAMRRSLVTAIKGLPFVITGLHGEDRAVVSAGGVDLTEVDFRTMESRLVPHLHIVGDVLNIDRPTGGYSLQLCWTTGRVAGLSVVTT
jgi:predicted Rossmann fold flavoprotein